MVLEALAIAMSIPTLTRKGKTVRSIIMRIRYGGVRQTKKSRKAPYPGMDQAAHS
jgi:hypothetical protein